MNADLGQMPFPPMVMNGPHFHPPMNITINQLPNMNPRAENNPIGIQVKEYKRETEQLEKIIDKITKSYDENGHKSSNFNGQTTNDVLNMDMDIQKYSNQKLI